MNVVRKERVMDELIQLISTKTGLSEDQSRQAAQVAIDFVKEKLPEPIRGQVDAALSGDMSGLAGQAQGMLGGLFGK